MAIHCKRCGSIDITIRLSAEADEKKIRRELSGYLLSILYGRTTIKMFDKDILTIAYK